jgi:hypothetical protein
MCNRTIPHRVNLLMVRIVISNDAKSTHDNHDFAVSIRNQNALVVVKDYDFILRLLVVSLASSA